MSGKLVKENRCFEELDLSSIEEEINTLRTDTEQAISELETKVESDMSTLKTELETEMSNLESTVNTSLTEVRTALNGLVKYREYTVNFGSVVGLTDSIKNLGDFATIEGYTFLGFTVTEATYNAVGYNFAGRFEMHVTNNKIIACCSNPHSDTLLITCKFMAIFVKNSQ